MFVRVYRRDMMWPLVMTKTLPIKQRLIWIGPLFILIAWGESARLIKEAA